MKKPVLVIMAAGMGSRFGGLKQMEPVDGQGNKIIDFSVYDAAQAGFEKVIFIINKENLEEFQSCVGNRIAGHMQVEYAFQEISGVPEGFFVPEGRVKPWGTAHAVLSCKGMVQGPMAVINADDYYGKDAFRIIYDYLSTHPDGAKYRYAMVGYELQNTLTDHGSVSRGVCKTNDEGFLTEITELTHIEKRGGKAVYTLDGERYAAIAADTTVSMNLWGFNASILEELEHAFLRFMKYEVPQNPLKAECYLPFVVDSLLKADQATVQVLNSWDRWFGVTYPQDKPLVAEAIKKLKKEGLYPEVLWQ